ncbi:MAG: phosphate acetyltransferase [Pseudomonadota bacterium]
MSVLDQIIDRCRATRPRIVLPEGDDPRVRGAALRAQADGLADIVLLSATDASPPAGVEVISPAAFGDVARYGEAYFELRRAKGVSLDKAMEIAKTPLAFAALMVRTGDADGTLGGAVATTSDTVRTALQIIGRAPGVDTVSSSFLMLLADPHNRPVIFADCGLILQPTPQEHASIALASAETLSALTGEVPRIAFLSFSTKGSVPEGAHESLGRIKQAMEIVAQKAPHLSVDGELQFDAALVPDVAAKKAPDSPIAGAANVFVFPSLSAGNIGYKIAQRLGHATALGPILQGLAQPANDLSRGASAEDIYNMIAITGAQVRK